MAARLRTASGRRVFIKAVGPEPKVRTPGLYRREAVVARLLPVSVPSRQAAGVAAFDGIDSMLGGWLVNAVLTAYQSGRGCKSGSGNSSRAPRAERRKAGGEHYVTFPSIPGEVEHTPKAAAASES